MLTPQEPGFSYRCALATSMSSTGNQTAPVIRSPRQAWRGSCEVLLGFLTVTGLNQR